MRNLLGKEILFMRRNGIEYRNGIFVSFFNYRDPVFSEIPHNKKLCLKKSLEEGRKKFREFNEIYNNI